MQAGKEVPVQALQTMDREKYIQSVATARARCMMLLSLPFVQLKSVNGIDQDQREIMTSKIGFKNRDNKQKWSSGQKKVILTKVVDLLIDKRIRKMRSERSIR